MLLVCATRAKPTPNLPSLSRMRYFGPTPKAVASRSCCAVQASVGDRVTPTWITLRECSSIMKRANSKPKKRSVTGRGVAGPDSFGRMVQEGGPVLSSWPGSAHLSHVFLDRSFADAKTQLEQFAPDPFRPTQAVVPSHFLDQRYGLCGDLWFGSRRSGFVLPEEPKSLAVPAQKRLWLDNEERLFPGSNSSCKLHQEQPIRFVYEALLKQLKTHSSQSLY